MILLYLFLAALNGGCALYIAWSARKTWKYLTKSLRVLNVLCCAMNLLRALR